MDRILGLDIGVASVGWGIIDKEKLNIIDSGVRLFESADAAKNTDRRTSRQLRRLIRRRRNRLNDLKKLFEVQGFNTEAATIDSLDLRNQGLIEKLSKEEIVAAILHIAKRRGISYLEDISDEGIDASSTDINADALKTKYPCQIQQERMVKFGRYRGLTATDDGKILNNIFTTSKYRQEAEKILKNQQKFYPEITDDYINEVLSLLTRKRKYYHGPGSLKSRTDYGRFKMDGRNLDNIFEELIGKCSVYPTETRAASASYTAQEFNILNDLNNIRINLQALTPVEKMELINYVKNSASMGSRTLHKEIARRNNVSESMLTGYRVDRDEKPEYHTFEPFRKMKNFFSLHNIDIETISVELLDELAKVLTLNTEKEGILEEFSKNPLLKEAGFSLPFVENICSFRTKESKQFGKWHSLSLKAMREIRDELINTNKNQSSILHEMGKFKTNIERFTEYRYIPAQEILKEIYNPIARRSISQTIKVTNALIKEYGPFSDIVIEMPREFEAEGDAKQKFKKMQLKNEKALQEIINKIQDQYGIEVTGWHFRNHKNLNLKLKLWEEQGGVCPYSGKNINIEELLANPNLFEIDHIIPISVSFDDSQNNKTLVFGDENQKKKNRTPFAYIGSRAGTQWGYSEYRNLVIGLHKGKKISDKKKSNYLFESDINKFDVLKSFIARNLNDTRYASRVVLNSYQDFFKAHGSSTKVKVIRGAFTAQFRKLLKLGKDRDVSFAHHGVDALICAYSALSLNKYLNDSLHITVNGDDLIDLTTGEIITKNLLRDDLSDEEYMAVMEHYASFDIRSRLATAELHMKYSHKVDRKVNRAVSNQTIYSTRHLDGKDHVIEKIKDIYNDAEYVKLKKLFDKDDANSADNSLFLMRRYDPQTFEILKSVIYAYPDAKNPFVQYRIEHGPLRKFAKNNNGPAISQIKYLANELGTHIDISGNYSPKDRKVVLQSLNPFRSDIYYDVGSDAFRVVGLKYSTLRFKNGNYVLNKKDYLDELVREGVINSPVEYADRIGKDVIFKFSLYKNDLLAFGEDEDSSNIYRFLSRTMPNQRNYIEVKPIEKDKYEKRMLIGINKKIKYIKKINTDILGNKHYLSSEKIKLDFDIDSNGKI